MSIPYFPMYPDDFEADTAHLSLAEDGAYNRLLRLCWRSPECKLPDDLAWIYRRMRAFTDTDQAVVKAVLDEFFTRKAGKVWSARLLTEYVTATGAHSKRVSAGSKGGTAKAMKTKEAMPSNARAMPYQPEPEPEPLSEGKPSLPDGQISKPKPPPKARLPADWALSDEGWAYARSHAIPDQVIEDEARGFHAYWTDRRDRDASKSAQGWEQCWANRVRTIAGRYAGRGMAGAAGSARGGQNHSMASIIARRHAERQN